MSESDIKNVSSRNLFFLKVVIWTLRMQFWKPRQKVLTTSPKLPAQCLKMILEKHFFSKNLILRLFLWTRLMQLWPPFRKLSHKNPKVFLISENHINYIFFKTSFLSSKLFLQTRIMQFWQPCQKNCARSPKIFRSISEKDKTKLTCLKKNLSKCCHGCVECSIENPAEKFLTKSRKVFAECPKMIIKIISLRFVFPHNISMDTYNGVLTTLPKKLCQKP